MTGAGAGATRGAGSAQAAPAFPPRATLRVAMLLSVSGGFLDAFTWVAHGGVFANAQTGNVVLLSVFAATGQWPQALRHVPPIAAFVLGVFLAHLLRAHGSRAGEKWEAAFSLAVEIAVLAVVAVLPRQTPHLPIVLGIACVAALQSSTFARIESWAYSSVMTTGNLRRTAEAFFRGTMPRRGPGGLHEARVFATICTSFATGAAIGAFTTTRLANAALAVPIAILVVALWLCMRPPASNGR